MKNRICLVACALVSVAAAAACTGGDDGGGGGGSVNLRIGDIGGFVLVAAGSQGGFGNAALYDEVVVGNPDEVVEIAFGNDECIPPTADTEITYSYLDAGASMTAVSGSFSVPMLKDTTDGITYGGFVSGAAPSGTDWTVSNSGSGAVPAGTIVSVYVPTKLEYSGTGQITTPGTAQEVEWTGAAGANYVSVTVFDSNDEQVYECRPANDGSFTIPAQVTTAAGAGGTFEISGFLYETADFQGKTLVVVGFGL